jgi:hypothetical protein
MIGILPFGAVWQNALNEMSKIDPTKDRDVKLRIYKDYDALRHYQAYGIERLRNMITDSETSDEGDEQVIGDEQ